MNYTSHMASVTAALRDCKREFCTKVGVLLVAEVQPLVPVDTGNLRRSIVNENMSDNAGLVIGVTEAAPYGLTIEKGFSGHRASPYLEPGVMSSIPKIKDVAEQVYRNYLGRA